jgi:MFS family permease
MLAMFGVGAVFVFINFLALRQAVTPSPLLGRMTSTMRWLIMVPGIPGALIGGWLGEHLGLQSALAFAGGLGLALALVAIRLPVLRDMRSLPEQARESAAPLARAAPARRSATPAAGSQRGVQPVRLRLSRFPQGPLP